MNGREVWVTGMGAVTAAGRGVSLLRQAMLEERSAVQPQRELNGLSAASVPELPRSRLTRRLDRSAAMFVSAAQEAWSEAGLDGAPLQPDRCAVIEGSSLGSMADLLRAHARSSGERPAVRPSRLVRFMSGAGGATFAQAHGFEGPVFHLSAGSTSAATAIGEGFLWIEAGRADVVMAGGAECPLHPEVVEHFRAAGILAERDGRSPACRPFDAERAGTVLGEGGGAVVIEAAEHARKRRVSPLAVLRGYGLSCESHNIVAPHPDGAGVAAAARRALSGAGLARIGWIKTHGTGTQHNDAAECSGLAALFGCDLPGIPLTGLKPYIGHCLGASGAVEAVAAVLALRAGCIPATLGTERVDPDLPPCTVVTRSRESDADAILLLAASFGGKCSALVVGRA
ncbi:MAG: beta-ketoacyl-[acyl-carrier-protein] synthase family protein [Gemmatimonadota bacterium]